MIECFLSVTRADKIRCRPEDNGKYLLYNSQTDQLHLVDEIGKKVFDLCDGRAIDDVVREAAILMEKESLVLASQQVLNFLCELKKRHLVVMH